MILWGNNKKIKKNHYSLNNNRINFLMAVIFLFCSLMIYKLYNLQIVKNDLYIALASDQHQITSILEPERGKIYIQDNHGNKLYPVATNKEFALVYAIPQDIKNKKEVAEQLVEIFKLPQLEKEVDELLNKLEEGNEIDKEFRPVKREAEINLRKEIMVEEYLKILTKRNDPYEPIAERVEEETLNKIKQLNLEGIDYIIKNYRYYPDNNFGSHMLGFVGYVGDEKRGQYGLEGFFDQELYGSYGSIKAARSAVGDVMIINDREYNKPQNGSELILTINRTIQYTVCQKLNEASERLKADGGSVIVIEPFSGAVLAMCSWPDYDSNNYQEVEDINIFNNPAILHQYEPGSIFKAITMAASLDQGKIKPETTYQDEGLVQDKEWKNPIKNADYDIYPEGHGIVDMNTVLVNSLNTGSIFAMRQVGPEIFSQYVKNFGFGEKTGIELDSENPGNTNNITGKTVHFFDAATASFGQSITVTPIQMITAYAVIANGGILMKPYLVKEIINKDGSKITAQPKQIRQVISQRTSLLLSAMLVNVVDSGHAKHAQVEGYWVAGKTGTAQVAEVGKKGYSDKTIHTFVGFAPVDEPKFVMLIKLDNPKVDAYAASTAAPLFGELAEFMLQYWQVAKER